MDIYCCLSMRYFKLERWLWISNSVGWVGCTNVTMIWMLVASGGESPLLNVLKAKRLHTGMLVWWGHTFECLKCKTGHPSWMIVISGGGDPCLNVLDAKKSPRMNMLYWMTNMKMGWRTRDSNWDYWLTKVRSSSISFLK